MSNSFSPREFRDSLGLFATGIAVATASDGQQQVGITINSFASVSLDPPLVLFSVSRRVLSFPVFERARGFAINVLRKDQKELSDRFARPGTEKWLGVEAAAGSHGGVIIQPSLVSFDCEMHRQYDGGDHVIFVGRVAALVSAATHEPLVYFRSSYHELSPQPGLIAA